MVKRCAVLLVILAINCGKGNSDGDVLATVNEVAITRDQLETEFQTLPEKSRSYFENDKVGLLEQLINTELLFQEATGRGIGDRPEVRELISKEPENEKTILIQALIEDELNRVEVSDEELVDFYQEHKDKVQNDFENVESQLREILLSQKQREHFDAFLPELRAKAHITRNEGWVESQTADNPLDRVLGKGKPVLADFGRGVCIPCKKMKPILQELKEEYRDRVHVLIIEIDPYKALTRKHRVRLIPTQIFFDEDGNEYYRHEGFMSKEDILTKLKEMGVTQN